MVLKLSDSDVAFIQQLPVCRVATATKNGNPRVRPVWAVFDRKRIYFATDPGTVKLKHIKENPAVSIVFDDYDRNNWSSLRGIRIQGSAKTLTGGNEYRYAHALLKEKYPEYRHWKGGGSMGKSRSSRLRPVALGNGPMESGKNRRLIYEASPNTRSNCGISLVRIS